MIRAVLFDMDGVIVDSEPVYFKRKKGFFKSIGIDVTDEQLRMFVGSNFKNAINAFFPTYSAEEKESIQRRYRNFTKEFEVDFKGKINEGGPRYP